MKKDWLFFHFQTSWYLERVGLLEQMRHFSLPNNNYHPSCLLGICNRAKICSEKRVNIKSQSAKARLVSVVRGRVLIGVRSDTQWWEVGYSVVGGWILSGVRGVSWFASV